MDHLQCTYPYVAGVPVGFRTDQWVLLIVSVMAGFLSLELIPATSFQVQLSSRLLFVGIPLGTLLGIAGRHTNALFRKISLKDVCIAVLTAVLAILSALLVALVVQRFAAVSANSTAVGMAGMSIPNLVLNLLSTAPQLLGEELLTILPFLALLRWATIKLKLSYKWGIGVALIGSTSVFCAAHLPTYQWNWVQCFGVIGASRLVLTMAYIMTRNLWVSTGAHLLTDWTEFSTVFLASSASA